MGERLFELIEALDKDRNPVEKGFLPKGCRFAGQLDKILVVEISEEMLTPSVTDRMRYLRESAFSEGIIVAVPPGTRFLKLREVK